MSIQVLLEDVEFTGDIKSVFSTELESQKKLAVEMRVVRLSLDLISRGYSIYGVNRNIDKVVPEGLVENLPLNIENFAPLTKAYVAATTSTKDTLSVTVGSVGSIGFVVSGVVTAVTNTVANPTRDNDLIYRVNSGGTAWEYVSGA